MPRIFRKAMRILGPGLNNFVKVVHSLAADIKAYDAWNARNHFYSSIEKNDIITISFYFLHHEIFISGYKIKPFNLGLDNWCIVGCRSVDDVGVIIDHQNLDNELYDNLYVWCILICTLVY